ncbi:AhpC/TSA family protein [Candidatus Synechococcus calcipolaris G9]|uniref:thioredoxin-dependent peroxiredoxin n=1 Tax=Candidatus Synechococcus calcipolaris G9 TaxID=1497997 RepID=A0ABT6EVJ8_9SYNE|nr:peroxiredoxin-like family protein [Candidatus Synechococcus calcipolaris]MDG2989788.1 AhpC/TSA family protein [Candidatus Synechococcus calcipolaris G9]
MSFATDLATLTQNMQQQIPTEIKETMMSAMADLMNSGLGDRALGIGDGIPRFSLPNALGEVVNIQDLLNHGPVIICFYRGGWCPYCNLELHALEQTLPQFKALGANLVAISPQTPDHTLSTVEKQQLSFEVLSDRGNQVARQFGLVFTVPEILRPIYQQFGIDLPAANGDVSFELPVAATYVVKADGTIAHGFVNVDYTQRQDPQEILAVLKKV